MCLIAFVLSGLWLFMVYAARDNQLHEAQSKARNLATTLANHARQSITAADIVLTDVVERAEHDGLGPINAARIARLLQMRAGELSGNSGFSLIDSEGRVVVSTTQADGSPALDPALDFSERPYFKYHRESATNDAYVGTPTVEGRGGQTVFPVSRAIRTPDGQFNGVALATLSSGDFQAFYERLDSGRHGVLRLLRDDGIIIVRKPYQQANVGANIAREGPLLRQNIIRSETAIFPNTSSIDGIKRWNALQALPQYHLVAVAGLSEVEELARWKRETIQQAIGLSAVVIILAGFSIFLVLASRHSTTMRRMAEERETRLKTITDNLPVLISYVDADRKIQFINATGERWFARPAKEILGRSLSEILNREPTVSGMDLLREEGSREPIRFRRTRPHPDGKTRTIEGLLVPDIGPDGKLLGYHSLSIDVSDREAIEEQLRQAQKMEAVGQLTSGVAHDFNNLMGIIVANLDLMESEVRDRPQALKLLRSSVDAVERGAALTRRLLAFSRKQALQPEKIDVVALLAGLSEFLRRTLGEAIKVESKVAEGLWPCFADQNQLENALVNLAINARDAMPDGGNLLIEAANFVLEKDNAMAEGESLRPGRYVSLAITDNGTGMPPEVLERALEPFFTTKEVGKGSGLGLSMVYGLVKQSGGFIRLYSDLGHGTTVKLFLPAASETAQPEQAEQASVISSDKTPKGAGQLVLLVEDNPDMREVTAAALRRFGYTPLEADNAIAAMAVLAKTPGIALLLTDVILPGGKNGFELARDALTLRPDLKVIYASGYSNAEHIEQLKPGEKIELLNKPFRLSELATALARAMETELPA